MPCIYLGIMTGEGEITEEASGVRAADLERSRAGGPGRVERQEGQWCNESWYRHHPCASVVHVYSHTCMQTGIPSSSHMLKKRSALAALDA